MKESKLWMMSLLAILAVVCSAALGYVNIKIDPVIKQNERVHYKRIILNLFAVTYDPLNPAAIEETYTKRIEESAVNGIPAYTEKQSGRKAVSLSGNGFQGPIQVLVALDGGTVTAFRVVSQVETPGLGSRITEEGFQKSFEGKTVDRGIKLVKGGNAGKSEFDAITGATETSRALERLLNAGLAKYFDAASK
ncbi:MAG: FMN-binding protein [Candidatus Latescibacterota bacterium]